jgi:hypothetical protein
MAKKKWDVFICHASEDKASLVKPLADTLKAFGVRVWFDLFTLTAGDSLSKSIDKGLSDSKFGIVVISKSFFTKKWTEYELRGLTTLEIENGEKIIPLWYGISKQDVLKFSPALADKLAILTDNKTPLDIAIEIIEIVRPDIFERVLTKVAFKQKVREAPVVNIPVGELHVKGPVRHPTLPVELIRRIRLIRAALLLCYPHSMEYWVEGFKRDSHPSIEISEWERISAAFLEYVLTGAVKPEQYSKVMSILLRLSCGEDPNKITNPKNDLPEDAIIILTNLFYQPNPIFDFQETGEVFIQDTKSENDDLHVDIEKIPDDIPNELIDEILNKRSQEKKG